MQCMTINLDKVKEEEECEIEEEEHNDELMDNNKSERFLCLLALIRQEKEQIFGELKKITSDGTPVTADSKRMATEKVAQATFDLGFTRRLLDYREWRQRFWCRWKGNAKRRKEKRLREGGPPVPWEAMILDICGIDRQDPPHMPALQKYSALLSVNNGFQTDSPIVRNPIEMFTASELSFEALVNQLKREEEEQQQSQMSNDPLTPDRFQPNIGGSTPCSERIAPARKRPRLMESLLPNTSSATPVSSSSSDFLAKTQALLNILDAIPKAESLGYDIHPSFFEGFLIKK